jgi:hypothetical protein
VAATTLDERRRTEPERDALRGKGVRALDRAISIKSERDPGPDDPLAARQNGTMITGNSQSSRTTGARTLGVALAFGDAAQAEHFRTPRHEG